MKLLMIFLSCFIKMRWLQFQALKSDNDAQNGGDLTTNRDASGYKQINRKSSRGCLDRISQKFLHARVPVQNHQVNVNKFLKLIYILKCQNQQYSTIGYIIKQFFIVHNFHETLLNVETTEEVKRSLKLICNQNPTCDYGEVVDRYIKDQGTNEKVH